MAHSKMKKVQNINNKDDERFVSFLPNSIATILAILSFMTTSISSVYFNNSVFKKKIKFPVFVSFAQQLVGMTIMSTVALIKYLVEKNDENENNNEKTDVSPFTKLLYAMPVAFFFSFNISFNNICLTQGKVSTYAMAKSTTLMWSLLLQYLILGIKVKMTSLISCFIILCGVLLGAFDPSSLLIVSLIYGCVSSFSQSCYNITLKWVLPRVNNDAVGLLKYVQLCSIIFFFIPMYFTGEVKPAFTQSGCFDFSNLYNMGYLWSLILISALLAIGVNQSTYFVIGLTTPATFNVCGLAKQALQTLGGFFYWSEVLSKQTICAVCLTFSGSASYTVFTHFANKTSQSTEQEKVVNEKLREAARQSIGTASDAFENPQDYILESNNKREEIIPLKSDIEKGQN